MFPMMFNPSRSKLTPKNHLPNYQLSPTAELMNVFSTSSLNPLCPVVFGHYQDKCIQLSVFSCTLLTTILFLLFPPLSNFPLLPSYPKLSSRFTAFHGKTNKQTNTPTSSKISLFALRKSCFSSDPLKGCLFFHLSFTYSNFLMQGHGPNHNSQSVSCKNFCPCIVPAPWNYLGGGGDFKGPLPRLHHLRIKSEQPGNES